MEAFGGRDETFKYFPKEKRFEKTKKHGESERKNTEGLLHLKFIIKGWQEFEQAPQPFSQSKFFRALLNDERYLLWKKAFSVYLVTSHPYVRVIHIHAVTTTKIEALRIVFLSTLFSLLQKHKIKKVYEKAKKYWRNEKVFFSGPEKSDNKISLSFGLRFLCQINIKSLTLYSIDFSNGFSLFHTVTMSLFFTKQR